jgi:hypothetical protein
MNLGDFYGIVWRYVAKILQANKKVPQVGVLYFG